MGIEEIQKVNALARELMRHGIAVTSDEALLKAEDMLKGDSVNSMTAAITSNTSIGQQRDANHGHSNEVLTGLNMDVRSLGMRFDAIAKEVLGLREDLKKLGGNMSDMSRQITRLSVQQAPAPSYQAPEAQPELHQQVQQSFSREAIQPVAEKPKPVMARAGKDEFKPEDVAIEKIFYFGK